MSRPTAAAFIAVSLLIAGCSHDSGKVATSEPTTAPPTTAVPAAPPASEPPPATVPAPRKLTLEWAPCSDGFQCATGHPPLDYDHPGNGETADIAVARLPASGLAGQRLGALFVNPGGPGAAAISW